MTTAALLAVLAAGALPASAQSANPFLPVASTATAAAAPVVQLGKSLPVSGGPWIVAETLFFSGGRVVSDYAWRDKLRAKTGQVYAAADLQGDLEILRNLKAFNRVSPAIYEIPNNPIAPQFTNVSVSPNQVRVVFDVDLKESTGPVKPKLVTPPSAVSGLILTPTAFRGAGKHNAPGMGLDINAAYFIGRLYGKNSYPDAPAHTNYLDRTGIWMLTADGKMQIQSDAGWRPAVAVGGQAMFLFRDSPQPSINTPAVSVTVNAKSTQMLTDGYFVVSKNVHGLRTSAGMMQGNIGNLAGNLSEFLTPEAIRFYRDNPHNVVGPITSRSVPFASTFYLLKPDYPIGVEVMKFNGANGSPMLIDFKLGRLLHLNFDVALLTFRGGYDVLGLFQFRYNHFPRN